MGECRKMADLFGPYIYGDLSPDEMRRVRQHVEGCLACAEDLKARMEVTQLIPSKVPELSADEKQRITWSVKGAIRAKEERARPRQFSPVFVGSLAAILIVAAFGTGAIIGMKCKQAKKQTIVKTAPAPAKPKDIAKEPQKTDKPAAEPVELLAVGPERPDSVPKTYRDGKNKRRNHRDRTSEVSDKSATDKSNSEKGPIAPAPDSPNNADLGKLAPVEDKTNTAD